MTMKNKIRGVLTDSEYQIFEKLCTDAIEMYRLLNDRVNRDVKEEFGAMVGAENVPPEWKTMCELEWTERANKVLGEVKE